MKIYTNCWQSEPDFRPLISQILLQLQSMSLEPIFEGDDDKNSIYLLPPSDTSKNFISGIIMIIFLIFSIYSFIYLN